MGPRSPLRFGRCRTDVPRTSCNPSSARLRLLRGRRPWFKVSPPAWSARGMRSPRPHSPHLPQGSGRCGAGAPMGPRSLLRYGRCRTDVPRTSCNPSSARLRSLRDRRPWVQGLRSASVGAEQASPRTSCNPFSARLRLLRGRLSIMIRQERKFFYD